MSIIQQALINLVLPLESLDRVRANKCQKIFPDSQGAYINTPDTFGNVALWLTA